MRTRHTTTSRLPTRPSERVSLWLAFLLLGVLAPDLSPDLAPTFSTGPDADAARPVPAVVAPVRAEVLSSMDEATPGARLVALTFDDGPDPYWTPKVLDLLERSGAVGTFCMIGRSAAEHPDVVRRVVAAGMRLCDHSETHDLGLANLPAAQRTTEIIGPRDRLTQIAGSPVSYFRAPGGYWTPALQAEVAVAGMRPLGWSLDTRDWKQPAARTILQEVTMGVRPGTIVLLHDGGGRRGETVAALEQLLPWLRDNGYSTTFPTP